MIPEKFWAKVDRTGDCWVWTGARYPSGYGRCYVGRKDWLAHRYALLLTGVELGHSLVCHACDNPPCVRPDHLFLGTASDNTQDMLRKGRSVSPLTPDQIHAIQLNRGGAHPDALAEQYGVSRTAIDNILKGQSFSVQKKEAIDAEFSDL
jgi:hypothetical protein